MMRRLLAGLLAGATVLGLAACGAAAQQPGAQAEPMAASLDGTLAAASVQNDSQWTGRAPKYVFLFIGDGMSYPQFQAAADYLGAVADPDYTNALPSVKDLEREEILYTNGEPFHVATTLECEDFAARQPSAAETQVVNEAIATIQYYQALPLLSLTFTINMLNRVMEELEVCSDASGCLEAETDAYGKAVWRCTSETAIYYGLSSTSTEYWATIDLLQASVQAYAADKELALDA